MSNIIIDVVRTETSRVDAELLLGFKGDKGDTGETPHLMIGAVETLAPTVPASATITGTAERPVLNLGLPTGLPTDAQTAQAVSDWLNEHPEVTTTVQDGSLTEAKFSESLKLKTIKDYVTPEMFGAKGDGIADDHDAIVNAFNEAYSNNKVIVFSKQYYSSQSIAVANVPDIEMTGTISFNNCNGLILGQSSSYIENKTIRVRIGNKVQDYSEDITGLKIVNMVNCQILIDKVGGFNTAVHLLGDSGAIAYNTFYLNEIRGGLFGIKMEKQSSGYVNENLFIGGRIDTTRSSENDSAGVILVGNNNVFVKPSVESAQVCFKFVVAQRNYFISVRSENATKLADFDDASYGNNISVGYGSYGVTDGSNPTNTIERYVWDVVDSALLNKYNINVWDSESLLNKVSIGASESTFTAPLKWLHPTGSGTPMSTCPSVQTIAVGNKLKIDGGAIGVMIDTTIAKDFAIIQGGSQFGLGLVKLYDDNGNLLDMENIKIAPNTTYQTGWGKCITLQNVAVSYIHLPTEAKKAFIGTARGSSATAPILFRLCVKSTGMSAPIY